MRTALGRPAWISNRIAEYKVKLSRANWEGRKYRGFPGEQVKLQFKKKGAARYATVKTVTTGNARQLTTEVTVTSADSWRWYFCDFAIWVTEWLVSRRRWWARLACAWWSICPPGARPFQPRR